MFGLWLFFSSGYEFVNNEIANIYNQRMEQYKRNPFYEYDYIVVPNKSDGSTDKEKIEKSSVIMQCKDGD